MRAGLPVAVIGSGAAGLAGDYFCTSGLNIASASGERTARKLLDNL